MGGGNVVNSMLIRFADEIKSERIGNTPVNQEKCYVGFLRLKIWEGSNKVRMKSDRYNPRCFEGGVRGDGRSEHQERKVQKTVRSVGWKTPN